MSIYYCHCEVCGIDFISHKSQRKLCNMCSTKGTETKEVICKKCGKTFVISRNPNDENNFYKKNFCPSCSGLHCKKCGKVVTKEEYSTYGELCKDCYVNNHKHYCTKCGVEIEVENIPGTNKYLPKGKKRKLCNKCYAEFLKETKKLACKKCGKEFYVGRSSVDGGFLFREFCPDCYNLIYKPEFKIKQCKKCGKEFKIYRNSDGKFTEHKQYCKECTPLAMKENHNITCLDKYGVSYSCLLPQCIKAKGEKISKLNLVFVDFLKEHNIHDIETEWYDEKTFRHYDLYLTKQDILIELNPSYTHSILGSHYNGFHVDENKAKWQHFYRTKDVDKHVIHVWDWDNWDSILQLIKPKQKLYARKLQLKEINKQDANTFIDEYHIQGKCRGNQVNLGLYDNDKLVQVMTYGKPRYNKNYQWELLRLCTHSDYMVVGGAEKLFKYFVNNYNPDSVLSYCDISKFTGDVYKRLGFTLSKTTAPQKVWSKGKNHITDNLLRQRGFDQLFHTNYGKGTSNEQLMLDHHWLPVYDCGQYVFVWKIKL